MCDCFHLVLPNWPGSPASASGRQLRPEDTEADGEADAEDDSVDEVTTENIRPRPQGSSPVYEYCIEDEYFNKKLQQDLENRQRRASSIKMSDSQESMEVTLHTDVESGASGFSVGGGGNEGIFVKKVLKESPASKLFSLREGDQLLSATIFFDNIKYEDALKILQYSEPYKVQFSLKRKLSGKEDLETHSAMLSKKEKLSQGKEAMEVSEKTITEEDKANLIVKQRVGRQKRPKKDRLSWPKFQSIKGKKILGHRRSHSTSDAYEHTIPNVSPTSTDTEFPPDEIHATIKKGSQKKLKFPSIGFKMYRSKQEAEDKSKLEGRILTEYEYSTTGEPSEIITVEDSTSWAPDKKAREHYDAKKDIKESTYELTSHTKKCPEVEITIKKPKEKKQKSRGTTKPESTIVTSQITTSALEIKESPTKQPSFPKIRKKKQKGSMEKIQSKTTVDYEEREKETQVHVKDGIAGIPCEMKQDAEITVSPHEVTLTTGVVSDLKAKELQIEIPSAERPLDGSDAKLEGGDTKFKMPKFQMPAFGISLPKGKAAVDRDITELSIEAKVPKAELRGEVTVPSVETGIMVSGTHTEAPGMEIQVTQKGKMKMPDVEMPSVKLPETKGPQVDVTWQKVKGDISLPKVETEMPGEVTVKVSEPKESIEGGGMKMHMPKFKMPSMGFSRPDIKGPKVDVDLSAPKVDITLPSGDLSISKPELKTGELVTDIRISEPREKITTGQTLELKAADVQLEAPSAEIAIEGAQEKVEMVDGKFKMPKLQMPKFGFSTPKGKATAEGDVTIPSVGGEIHKADLKGEVTMRSVDTGIKVSGPQFEAPSLEVEVGEKDKMKMPDVKMTSVKLPKIKGPQMGVTLSKVEGDTSFPKVESELPEGKVSVKMIEAEGNAEGGGMKIHMPKFKMPSMGFSKPDIKGPKVDIDLSATKADVTLPSADVSIYKPELKVGEPVADISISAPEVKIPTDQASMTFTSPDLQVEGPSAEIAVEGVEGKLESIDGKFKMPKFQMPKFGVSLPKGKAAIEGDVTIPSVEAKIPKAELKGEVTIPSVETGIKVSGPQFEAPSMKVEVDEKGKMKMPDVQMPSVKLPKIKGPQAGVTLSRVEGDVSVPEVEAKLPEGEITIKMPEVEGSVEGGGMKIHMPKFKMPSMGFSKRDIKGPKVDVDVSAPKADITLPSTDLSLSKPELKTGEPMADITISAPEVKLPMDQASLELSAPDLQVEGPSAEIAVEGIEGKLEGIDGKFKMPKFQMPKFGVSLPKGKATVEGDVAIPSTEAEVPKLGLKSEVTMPSIDTSIKVSGPQFEAPSVEVEVGEKGKMKMPDVQMPSVKLPKMKGPQVGVTLPKVEGEVSLPKVEAELPEGEVTVKVAEAEGSVEGGGMKIHMPKFKMPSMGFSKRDVKGPKVDVDVSAPKTDITLPSTDLSLSKPELKMGEPMADITISAPEVKIPTDQASLELSAPDLQLEAPSAEIAVESIEGKLEGIDGKFKMPKFQMPKFGVSLPKGKGALEGDITVPSIEAEIPKAELKGEVTIPSIDIAIKLSGPQPEAVTMDVEISEKGKMKKPEVKMPSVKLPKMKGSQVGVTLSKVKGDASLPKVESELPEGEISVKMPKAEGSIEDGGMKIHKPKFKMPSMGFSKPDIKGPKVDVDLSAPKTDITPHFADLSISKPELQTGEVVADISVSPPEVMIPTEQTSLKLTAPDLQLKAPSAEITVRGPEGKLEGMDGKFKMPKLQMPKFGVSLPKGKAAVEGDIKVPSIEAEIPKAELKGEVTIPSVETGIKVSGSRFEAPSMEVEVSEKDKMKMPDVKMPSVKLPKIEGPQVGVTLSKVKGVASLPKVESELPEGEISVKIPKVEGSVEEGGMKIHLPKFKMPSMGFSRPDIKGPKVDVELSTPKTDITPHSADLSMSKPELQTGDIVADISVSPPEVMIPTEQTSLKLTAPDLQLKAPSAEITVRGPEGKLEGMDGKFKMPKLQMPKFGVSLPKGKAAVEGDITVPSLEAEIHKAELKGEVTIPSVETGVKLSGPQLEAPNLEVEVGEKGKMKMPEVQMPSVKLPKTRGAQVGVTLPKVEGEMSLPEAEAELPEGEVTVKMPEAEGSVEGGGMKIHMPKFKMPSMGFSKRDVKGAKVDVDISAPKTDITLPSTDLRLSKPELKMGQPTADITISAPEVKIPTDQASMELSAPDLQVEAPSAEIAVEGIEGKLEGIDGKFKMPKFQMPKFGVSLSKGKTTVEGDVTVPSTEVEVAKPGLKGEVTMPSLDTSIKVSGPQFDAPSMEVEVGERGRMKMPDVQMPSVKLPKIKGPEVGITLPKVEGEVALPKVEAEMPEGEVTVKMPEVEGSVEGGRMKMHMPKFKMPSMGFSKRDIKGPKVDVDISVPKTDITLPSADLSLSKPKLKMGEPTADITISAPEVKIPTDQASLELSAPDLQFEAPSAEIAVEGIDGKFKMPKFQMPKIDVSLPEMKAAIEGDVTVPPTEVEVPKSGLKSEVTMPSIDTRIKVSGPQFEAPSVEVEVGEKGKMKMPDVKMPSVKLPKMKGPQVGVTLPKVEGEVSLSKVEAELPEGEVTVKMPEVEGSVEGGRMKMHMPKFKMPSMGFSKRDVKGPKVDVDISAPKTDITLPSTDLSLSKPELKVGEPTAEISISAPEIKIPTHQASMELSALDLQVEGPSAEIAVEGIEGKLEGIDGKFKMPKFQMPKFGVSLPKGKATVEGDVTVPPTEAEVPKLGLKGEVTMPSIDTSIKVSGPQFEAPSVEVEVGEKGKMKMPDVQMPSVKLPKMKGPQVGVTLPKVDGDVSLPKVEPELPEGEVTVKMPEVEGSVEGGRMKMHMPKFKMPSMGFSKRDVKGPKVDVDISAPKTDITLPSTDLSLSKPELKVGEPTAEISISAPEIKIPTHQASMELSAPDLQVEGPSAEIAVEGIEGKLEGIDGKFKMPKFQMPKFGVSLPKGKATVEGDVTVPPTEAEVPKLGLKGEVTMPSIDTSIKVSGPQFEAPSVEVEVGEKGKIKMPDVQMPSVKLPKMKGPQVGVTLPKVEGEVSLPKVEAEIPEGEVTVKMPEVEGSVEGGRMKMHMPKFKMPSMGFSKRDVKGPKVDVDISAPKTDITLPSTDLSLSKPELKVGEPTAEISISAPEIKIPTHQASMELSAPDLQVEGPSAEIAVEGIEGKLEGIDGKFKMPKFQMPKFGVSLPKGKATVEGDVTVPPTEAEVPKLGLKGEVTMPSIDTSIKVSGPQFEAPSVEVEVGEKGKMKMPDVQMPSVKLPKMKGPQVGVTLPKVEGDVSLPKVEAELPEGEVTVKMPEVEGSVEGGRMKMHMPKFKMPSMGFSKRDVKGPKVDVDISAPKTDITLPSTDLSLSKPELKVGEPTAEISISAPEIKIPTHQASMELSAPDLQVEGPSAEIAVEGIEGKLEGIDGKFKMPKFQMPKFGVSLPKGKATVEGDVTVPPTEAEVPKLGLKGEVTMPSIDTSIKVSGPQFEAPSVEVEVGEKGKIKMPDVQMPSVKLPKMKGPQVGVTLPKVEGEVSLPKVEAEMPEGEVTVKMPEVEGSVEGGRMKMHMPKFKMPSMGFSKRDVKGPKVDVDISAPKTDITLPSTDLSLSKAELKVGEPTAEISISAPEVKIPTDQASMELSAPDLQVEAPSVEIAVEGIEGKLEGIDGKFKMPKFQMPKFGVSLPKGKAAIEGDVTIPSTEVEVPKSGLKSEVTMPSIDTSIKVSGPQFEAPSVEVEVGEKGKMKMPDVQMPSAKLPKMKGPQVGVTLPKVEGDVSLPKVEAELPEGEVTVKMPEVEGSVEGGRMKMHMPKFKMPSMGFSKRDVKGPKVDVDISAPKTDITLPSTDLSLSKPELKVGEPTAEISISAPEIKIPTHQASMELSAPDLQVEGPSAEIAVEGIEGKLEGIDGKFKMPKFQMPKFGVSLPKGKATVEGDVTVPPTEAEVPKLGLKGEVTMPSIDTSIKVSGPQFEAPSVEVEVGEKGKMKMPDVQMPSVKLPKMKGPQVGVTLPKVEGDVSLPKVEAELPEGEVTVKMPEVEGSVEGGRMKMHMPKFKMPSMGFSKRDIKGPKVDVDISAPKTDITLPSADLSLSKPKLKMGEPTADITISAPEVKIPTDQASLELSAPDLQFEAPSTEIAVEGIDGKFKMPKFQMPKFDVSLPEMKAAIEGDVTIPSTEVEVPKSGLKSEVTMPSIDTSIKVSGPQFEAPSVEVEVGEKGKMKMPDVKMPSVKLPKMKGPQVGVTLPKVEGEVSLSKVEAELPEGEVTVKMPEVEGSVEGGRMKMHMPKFKMPSMGFSKRDVKGPKVDVDISAPKTDITLPSTDLSLSKPELKVGEPTGDISISAAEVKIPTDQASLELSAPDLQLEAPSAEIAVEGIEGKLEGIDGKFKMPKFQIPKFGVSFPKGKAAIEGDVTIPSTEVEVAKPGLKGEVTMPSLDTSVKVSGPQFDAPSMEVEVGEKGKMKMPDVQMPSVKLPKIKGPEVGITLPKVDGDVSAPKVEAEMPEGETTVKMPEVEGSVEGGGMKIHMPKFKMPSMGFSRRDVKGPKVDVDISTPQTDITLPSADLSLSKPELKNEELAADIRVSAPEVQIPTGQASLELKAPDLQLTAPSVDIGVEAGEAKLEGIDGQFKRPKFQMPKFGISFPKGKAAVEGDITVPSLETDLKGDVTVPSLETGIIVSGTQNEAPSMEVEVREKAPEMGAECTSGDTDFSAAEVIVDGSKGKMKMPKFHMPKFGLSRTKEKIMEGKVSTSKADIDIPGIDTDVQILDIRTIEAPAIDGDVSDLKRHTSPVKVLHRPETEVQIPGIDVSLPSVDVSLPKSEVNIQGTDFDIKGLKMETSEKDTTEKESKFKMPKFKLPSFNWSPKKEASISGHVDADWEGPILTISTSEREPELTLTVGEIEDEVVEAESHVSIDKDGERSKMKRPQFSMPKLSLPKMRGHKAEMSVSQLETDISVSEQEDQGDRPTQIAEKEISGEETKKSIKMPKVKLPSLELSKPEIKTPRADMEVSLPKSDTELPTSDVSLSKPEVKLGDAGMDIRMATSEIKGSMAEGPSAEISVDGAEFKVEGVEGKMKKPKFQMPKFGISFPKGKAPDAEVTSPSVEAEAPQLRTTTDIADIAVEATALEDEYAVPGGEAIVVDEKIRIPPIPKGSMKTSALDIKLPSVGVSLPEKDIESLGAVSKEEKPEDLKAAVSDTEEKEGHFKMPKFKLPSFSWSPKKEGSLKPDVKESLEEPKVTLPEDTDSELTVVISEDQGVQMDLDAEMSSKKGQMKRPHFAMPKISLSKPKLPKSQASLSKAEKDITEEREGEVVQIPDIESSFTTKEEGTEISIKMPKGMPKPEIKAPKIDIDAEVPTGDTRAPMTGRSFELRSSEGGFEGMSGEIDMDSAGRTGDGLEIRLPKLRMPKFGVSVPEEEASKSEIVLPVMKAEASKLQTTEKLEGEAPVLKVQTVTADVEMKGSSVEIQVPQIPAAETEAPDPSAYRLSEKDIDVQGEHDIQTEGYQGWFKMPKFRMPSFGRSSLKGKKGDAEDEGSIRKVPTADVQVEIKTPGTVAESLHVDAESSSGKDSLEGQLILPQGAVPEGGVSIQKEKGSDFGLSEGKGRLPQPAGKMDIKLSVEGSKTYADAVKHGAEEQLQKSPFSGPRGDLCGSEISVPKVEAGLPERSMALQHKAKPDDASSVEYSIETKRLEVETDVAPSAEITVDGSEGTIDIAGPKEEIVVQSQDAVAKTEKTPSQTTSPKKGTQGKESLFKMPKFSMSSFGWSTPKTAGHIAEDIPNLEEAEAALPEVKMDASITDEDFEIIEFPVEGFEKDMSTEVEVKAEEKDRASKTKASKFKMPKFGSLRSKSRGSEVHTDLPKVEAEVSLAIAEGGALETQIQKGEGSVEPKSTELDTTGKESEDSELTFHIPKFKMPKFTHSSPTSEGQVLTLEGTTDGKCADTDGAPQLEFTTKVLEEKADQTGYDIQKSKVRITTLSEPAIQRTKVEGKIPSKESVFAETGVRIQRPMEFSSGFPKEQIDTMGSTIHKSIAKITTLTEPDIQTTQLEIQLPSTDSFTPDPLVHSQGPCGGSKETKREGTSMLGYDGSQSPETFSTQIVRESEIPPSEIKTATYGFSLLKLKMQEPHLSVGVPVKFSSTEDVNEPFESKDLQTESSEESSRISVPKTVPLGFKVSDKGAGTAVDFTEGASSTTTVTKLKSFTVEVQSSSEFAGSYSDKRSTEVSMSAVSQDKEKTKTSKHGEESTEQEGKSDGESSSGRFKFWLPSIGFSSSVDDTTADSKAEDQTPSLEDVQPKDSSATESDSAKQSGWFRFPKLGFSSPTKKIKEADKEKEEERDPKERKPQGEESPTEKTEMFFDAQETLPPKERVAETEEISDSTTSAAIVSSSARTELILLEKEKVTSQSIPEEPSK